MLRLILFAVLLIIAMSPAQATRLQVTYEGVLDFGNDYSNVFQGTPGVLNTRPLRGKAFKATFIVDTDLDPNPFQSQNFNVVIGGSSMSQPSPITDVSLTIDDTTIFSTGETTAFYRLTNNAGLDKQDLRAFGPAPLVGPNVTVDIRATITGPLGSFLPDLSFEHTGTPPADGFYQFSFSVSGSRTDGINANGESNSQPLPFNIPGSFTPTYTVLPIPEPGTIGLMLVGLLGIGVGARRR